MVSGHQEPALTVASLATTTTSRPSTTPTPVMTPAAGRLAVVLVVGDQQAELEPRRAGIEQLLDPLARARAVPWRASSRRAWRRRPASRRLGERPVFLGQSARAG